ncbi:polysaccharide export protein [Lysobacter lacus]|uniref:Polysaccharide export protein n=2 Tax=Cognatilysobacter lacus TaxID=1643323 RepID=A0A5D8ZEW7_9GAMM|nr:polysaccharide export protein [Lysobacter lacus]
MPPPAERGEYRIGANDLLSVVVFQVKDLDRDVRVNASGEISLPLIGVVNAAGLSVHGLETALEARYGARYLQHPHVTVFVKEAASQRVTVEGAVANPGIFPMTTRLSLLQAIALAHGPTNVANEHDVIVFRNVGGERRFARFDLKAIRNGELADPELFGEDVVAVDESGGKVWLRRAIELTPLLGVWSIFRSTRP